MFIDAHCHLTDNKYSQSEELDSTQKIVNLANIEGVKVMVDSGWNKETNLLAVENSKAFDSVYCVCGFHPEVASSVTDGDLELLKERLKNPKCLAVGEIGLDYHYADFDKDKQKEIFIRQMEIACELGKPIVIHSRDSSQDMLDILTENKDLLKNGFLLHCYSESKEQAQKYIKLGAYFTFGGVITFKNGKKEEIIKSIPTDRIMAETDSPYLTPEPYRGKINSPKNVVKVYQKLCDILGVDIDKLQIKLQDNFERFFKVRL